MKNRKLLINESRIDWLGGQSHYFFNPKHPRASEFKKIADKLPILKSHIYLYTSSGSKICLLSKKALLFSARLANQNLQAVLKDKWLISLPLFHVSGLSILARAFLSGSACSFLEGEWNPISFKRQIEKEKITLSSLVPTQIYDLIQNNLKAPSSLRALLAGGDFLSPSIYKKARDLSWPLLPCYGATETSSHIASASLKSLEKTSPPEMRLLEGIEVEPLQKGGLGFFKVKSRGLLTACFDLKAQKLYDPKDEKGSFLLEDKLSLNNRILKVHKSPQDQIKILGEKVNLSRLKRELQKYLDQNRLKAYFTALPEKRRGRNLVLVGEIKDFEKLFSVMNQYNERVSGYERIQTLYFLDKELLSRFLKLKPEVLLEELGFQAPNLLNTR